MDLGRGHLEKSPQESCRGRDKLCPVVRVYTCITGLSVVTVVTVACACVSGLEVNEQSGLIGTSFSFRVNDCVIPRCCASLRMKSRSHDSTRDSSSGSV